MNDINPMNELVSLELLANHGISGLSDEALGTLTASIIGVVNNRFTAKLLASLTPSEISDMEEGTEKERQNKLAELAKKRGLDTWINNEIELVVVEVAKRSGSVTH